MDRLAVAVRWVGLVESVTVMAAVLVPPALGVPVITPAVLIESPAGKPVAVKVKGATPPLSRTCTLYAVPTVPLGSWDVVIVTPCTTVIWAVALAIPGTLEAAVMVTGPTTVTPVTGTVVEVVV